jgi:hypothetical protein
LAVERSFLGNQRLLMTVTNQHPSANKHIFVRNVILKACLLFIIINLAVSLVPVGNTLGRLSLYNRLFPGRVRLPFGENPRSAYNLSLYDLEAMFASHEIDAGKKPEDEFRLILIGDSATWGTLLEPNQTLAGLINDRQLTSCDGRTVHAYNLAYPSMSLLKDLMILEQALRYHPDLILWPVTLQSFPQHIQTTTPLVANNPHRAQPLITQYGLIPDDPGNNFARPNFWDRTLIGRRRNIFDALQLQFYGVMWAATGIDQTYPAHYTPAQRDFTLDDDQFLDWSPPELPVDQLSMEIIAAGHSMAMNIPILLINEPILISQGENSQIRYNFFYPRWAYDQYRALLADHARDAGWQYLDLWDIIPEDQFTNSAVHLTPQGSERYLLEILPVLEASLCP